MKILALHSDFINIEAKKKAIKSAEEIKEAKQEAKECLVVFSAVEKLDEQNTDEVVKKLVENIKDISEKVKTKNIVLYPYAHLSSDLGSPQTALKILKDAENKLKKDFDVTRAPFGWYKSFTISCKGHPLSELSRSFSAEGVEKKSAEEEAIKAEEKAAITKKIFILDTNGKLSDASKFDFKKYPELKTFYNYDTKGSRIAEKEHPHIQMMREMELVDYEPGSDPGNFRWYPKGHLIKKLMEEKVSNMLIKSGAMQVETPIMYDYEHPALSKYLTRFPARQYKVISDNKQFFLRFSACFGQYLMKHDMGISYKNLPLKLYELTHYSFRREQRGELSGLKRLRTFTMPDMHTLCKDAEQAQTEFIEQYKLSMEYLKALDLDFEVAIRCQEDYYKKYEDFFKKLSQLAKRPLLVELFSERYAYFIMKFEFNVNDALNKAATLSTVQIDVENTERFDINYTDRDGKKKHPLLLHASISGSIDRDLYAILERESIKAKKGEKPKFPLWLSPTQVRLCTVSQEYNEFSEKLADEIAEHLIRVDIDDRAESLRKKIRTAEKEWIPYIIAVGEKEARGSALIARERKTGNQIEFTKEELIKTIKEKTKDMPFKPLSLPRQLSKRPIFVG